MRDDGTGGGESARTRMGTYITILPSSDFKHKVS
jgi:hypothetical protein